MNYAPFDWTSNRDCLNKTFDLFQARGLGVTSSCLLYSNELELHPHLFFESNFSMNIIRNVLPIGQLLMNVTLQQTFGVLDIVVNKPNKRLCLLNIVVLVYINWRKMNHQFHKWEPNSSKTLQNNIKLLVSYKLNLWNFKATWHSNVLEALNMWTNYQHLVLSIVCFLFFLIMWLGVLVFAR